MTFFFSSGLRTRAVFIDGVLHIVFAALPCDGHAFCILARQLALGGTSGVRESAITRGGIRQRAYGGMVFQIRLTRCTCIL